MDLCLFWTKNRFYENKMSVNSTIYEIVSNSERFICCRAALLSPSQQAKPIVNLIGKCEPTAELILASGSSGLLVNDDCYYFLV